jgi:nucleoside-diphosphate-sugar epimerase
MNETTRSSVLILGANGRLGASATRAFAAAGWHVLAQARRPPTTLPPGARHVGLDIADADGLARIAAGARAVVHAVNPPYTRWKTDLLPLAHQGMDIAQRLDARFMLPGNVYGFGAGMPPVLDEDTPERPTARKGVLRRDLEAAMAARAAQGLQSVVIRAGDFFGAGTGTWFDLVVLASMARGKLVYPGPVDVPHAWAWLPDLARTFVAVADAPLDQPFTRLHYPGYTLTGTQLLDAITRAATSLGLAPPAGFRRGGMPWGLIRVGSVVVPMWRELAEMAYLWRVPHGLDGTRLRHLLGDVPSTDLEIAMRDSVLALAPHANPPM